MGFNPTKKIKNRMSKEGSTEAPIRHPLNFNSPDFLDPQKLDKEMRRVLMYVIAAEDVLIFAIVFLNFLILLMIQKKEKLLLYQAKNLGKSLTHVLCATCVL